ncbi:MAG: Rpn family recombination-promoting nuclease/putative transposase [Paludibacter sp.]|jgi:predicted transposase/invertase (TIGR01784 family)|nr:Rpn family recombination-promoting nuclease/putative transposase [Paludibacter sp.]
MIRYLDPRIDLVFKKIFGENPDLAKSFLNALMPLAPDQQIEEIEYLPTEQVPDNPILKNSIVDVRCKDNFGRQFIVEMQMHWFEWFFSRMVFNTSKAYVRQLNKANSFMSLKQVYGLAILNDIFDKKTPEYYHHYEIINRKNPDEKINDIEYIFVELPKFIPETHSDKKMAVLWLRFLKEAGESNGISDDLKAVPEISKALDLCMEAAFTEQELLDYEGYWDAVREQNTRNEYMEKGLEKRMEEGMEKGRAEGIVKGRAEGIVKGRAEGIVKGRAEGMAEGENKKSIEIARKMLEKGISVSDIQELTGLSESEIRNLK